MRLLKRIGVGGDLSGVSLETRCGVYMAPRTVSLFALYRSVLVARPPSETLHNVETAWGFHHLLEKDAEYGKDSNFGG